MALRTLASAFVAVTLVSTPALAQGAGSGSTFDARSALQSFLTDPGTVGAQSATVGSISADGDMLTARDVTMVWSAPISVGQETVNLNVTITAPTLEVAGLARGPETYSAGRIAIPSVRLNASVEGTPEAIAYDLTFNDYVIENASWEPLPVVQANPAAPVSRFAPLVDWALTQSYDEASLGRVSGEVTTDGQTQAIDYAGASFGPVRDGVIETFSYGEVTSTQEMPNPAADPLEGPAGPLTLTVRYGPVTGQGLDMKPFAALLTGIDARDGPQPVLRHLEYAGMSFDAGDAFKVDVGPMVMDDFTIDPSRGPLMTQLDTIVTSALDNDEPDPQGLLTLALDIYGAFGIGEFTLSDVDATFPGGDARMGQFVIDNLSAAGIDRIAILDSQIRSAAGEGGLDAIEFAGFVFPDRDTFMQLIAASMVGDPPDRLTMMKAIPYLSRITLRGLEFDDTDMGRLAVGLFEAQARNFIDAIPTQISLALDDFSLPAVMLQDPMLEGMAVALGADPIEADGAMTLGWDEGPQEVTLDNDFTIQGVGQLLATARMSGIPRFVFSEPERAQEALVTAALDSLSVRFNDMGLTRFALGMVSQQMGSDPDQFIAGMTQQIATQVSMLTGDADLAASIAGELNAFLNDPQSIAVSAEPQSPVPLAQVIGAAMTAPQALPGLIGFQIVANQPSDPPSAQPAAPPPGSPAAPNDTPSGQPERP